MNKKVVLILSGGMDSTTLLYDLISQGKEVYALSFNYGQRHGKELAMAEETCRRLMINHKVLDIHEMAKITDGSCLTGNDDVPEGHYAEESMKKTVVHNRNMILLSMAGAYALNIGAREVYYGAHSGDHAIYPDCRPSFIEALDKAFKKCDWEPLRLKAPYMFLNKTGILSKGLLLKVDYSSTWTCYKGGSKACGKCGSCSERLEAFRDNKTNDPLEYEEALG